MFICTVLTLSERESPSYETLKEGVQVDFSDQMLDLQERLYLDGKLPHYLIFHINRADQDHRNSQQFTFDRELYADPVMMESTGFNQRSEQLRLKVAEKQRLEAELDRLQKFGSNGVFALLDDLDLFLDVQLQDGPGT